ncbi:MAG: radical SAM protein [Kiritimatiellae bacterium]|nr:radical SAM protein [Verrucomicrobiota bacterium]MBU4365704.1 radical SAM protein [Verrucomicrobiota bacterium]MCG2660725.1 radical SAM protein [Kiritimatiellia bacterium]
MKPILKMGRMGRIYLAYRRRQAALHYLPLRLWIETASCCNLRCVMCPNKDVAAADKGLMPLALFQKIIDQARHFALDINLHHRGEPLMNPALFDMIRYAKAARLKVRFHTNGTLLDEVKARRLLEAGLDLVSFSFDGFTRETYERVRVGATFEKTRDNILRLVALRREGARKKPYVVIEKIRFRNQDAEGDSAAVQALRQQFLDAGVDEIIEKEEYVWAEPGAPEVSEQHPCTVCTFPWYAMVICADGTITPCPQDFHAVLKLGNAQETSLKEIWNGPAYRQLRRQFATDIASLTICHKCDRLRRKTVGGVPLQYMATFLTDQLLSYGRLRKWLGTHERN